MSSRGCGAGCLTATGLFFAFVAFSSAEGLSMMLFFLGLTGVMWALAGLNIRAMLADKQAARERLRELQERSILEIAARHDGLISPAQVAMETRGLTVKAARALLDELAREGFCTLDSDDQGRPFYQFDVGQSRETGEELSADEWVERMSGQRRMSSGRDVELDL